MATNQIENTQMTELVETPRSHFSMPNSIHKHFYKKLLLLFLRRADL